MTAWVKTHRKAILGYLAALGAVCSFVATHQEWGAVAQWAGLIVAVLSGAGVMHIRNDQPAQPVAAPPSNMSITRPTGGA